MLQRQTTTMLAEVRLLIAPKEIRLILKVGDEVVEDELWKTDRKVTTQEAKGLAEVAFHDYFDLVNYSVNGE
jgi:hypothetical protein